MRYLIKSKAGQEWKPDMDYEEFQVEIEQKGQSHKHNDGQLEVVR